MDAQVISRRYIADATDNRYRPTGLRRQPTTPRGVLYAIGIGIGLAGVVSIVQAVML